MFLFSHNCVGLCMAALFVRDMPITSFSEVSQSHLGLDTPICKPVKLHHKIN